MKKFYTLLLAVAVTLTASALTRGEDKLITDPEGESMNYAVTASRFVRGYWGLDYIRGEYPANIVWGEDGVVYIRDIISSLPGGVYVKGILEDGQVKVQFPQVCYTEDGDLYYAAKMKSYIYEVDGEEYPSYKIVADEDNYVVYEVDEDRNLTLLLNDGDPENLDIMPTYIIGVCCEPAENIDDWYGYGDSYQTFNRFDEKPVTVPEGVALENWLLTAGSDKLICQVGFDGEYFYIVNCSDFIENIAFKGSLEIGANVVRFPVHQYMGQFDGYFLYLEAVKWTDDSWEEFEPIDEIVMTYDAERKILAVDNPLIDVMYCPEKDKFDPIEYFENPSFIYQNEEDANAAPENPYLLSYDPYQYQEWYDTYEGYIEWIIPRVNVKGYFLDTNRMYYHFLANGEVMTFTVEEYPRFEEDLTDIPYDFSDRFDVQVLDERHFFTFKSADIKSFGLQSFYIGTDGELYSSDIVTYIPEDDAVDPTFANKEIKAVEYYNLQGQRVALPDEGIYIMRTVCADGTTTVRKVIR